MRGRPELPEAERLVPITFLVAPADKERIKLAAKAEHRTVSGAARFYLLKGLGL